MNILIIPRTLSNVFKSYYHQNSYLPPVDLSEQALSPYMFKNEYPEQAAIAQRLISHPDVQEVLSKPLEYDQHNVGRNNGTLERHGFTLLSSKPNRQNPRETMPFYSVVEHPGLPGYVIKSGASRLSEDDDKLLLAGLNDRGDFAVFTKEESLMRLQMANRVAEVARSAGIELIVPKKWVVAYKNVSEDYRDDVTRKYCIICEKLNVLSREETVAKIKAMSSMEQQAMAQKITTIIEGSGLVDASFNNIRLTPEGKIALIDTEPAGLLVAKKSGAWNRIAERIFGPFFGSLFGYKCPASVEKCARVGLSALMSQQLLRPVGDAATTAVLSVDPERAAFHSWVEARYNASASPKYSRVKIIVSIATLGAIPLIIAIVSYVKAVFITAQGLRARDINKDLSNKLFPGRAQKQMASVLKAYVAYTDGVPLENALPSRMVG